jgi:hypothetical protein
MHNHSINDTLQQRNIFIRQLLKYDESYNNVENVNLLINSSTTYIVQTKKRFLWMTYIKNNILNLQIIK